jgi:hypothetical protein
LADKSHRGTRANSRCNHGPGEAQSPQTARYRPSGRLAEPEPLEHATLETDGRLSPWCNGNQVVRDCRELFELAPACRTAAGVLERQRALFAIGDADRELGQQVAGLGAASARRIHL